MTPSWIGILGSLTGAACAWLPVRESLWSWPVGTIDDLQCLFPFQRAASVVG